MSWQLASFAILFLALAGGFAWYERSQPSSKVLALVATLAALAAIGRLAFYPLPNVKPITDIVLLSGFVLGGAAGFTVGAVGALASNFVFGQGPWTPWQMAAWGLVGIAGAALGAATRREVDIRWLALACLLAGLFYGAIMDFSIWVNFTGSHTLSEYLAISASSFGFNLAHAIGNVVFCLAFGPTFVRALKRFRTRFDVTWRELPAGAVAAAAVALAVALPAAEAPAATPATAAAASERTVTYLRAAQNRDGGFGTAKGTASSSLYSAWTAMGLAAAGRHPASVRRGGATLAAYLRAVTPRIKDTGDLERHILALRAASQPTGALSRRLAGRLRSDGSIEGLVNRTAFYVLAQRAAGVAPSRLGRSVRWILRQQGRDGGWSFAGKAGASGIDDTAGAMQAIAAIGGRGGFTKAVRFLRRTQNRDGGYPLQPGGASNAQSTSWAIQAFVAAGVDPDRVSRAGSRSPMAFLASLVAADGSVRYSRTSRQTPVWVTAQAVTALQRRRFPIGPPRARRSRAVVAAAPQATAPAQPEAAPRKADARAAAARRARWARRLAVTTARRRERALVDRLTPAVRSAGVVAGVLLSG